MMELHCKRIQVKKTSALIVVSALVFFISCEKDITLNIPEPEQKIVVEGTIEPGLPALITLTNTIGFYGYTDLSSFDNLYVHEAVVVVSDGINSDTLQEICLNELTPELKALAANYLGVELDSLGEFPVDICLYSDPGIFTGTAVIIGEAGKTYSLTIHAEGKTLTSSTTIPPLVYLDSIYVKPVDDPANDSLVRLFGHFNDPPEIGNYYRMFTSQNGQPFYPFFTSVAEDFFINGKPVEFFIGRGEAPNAEDFETYGLFTRGDTVVTKFCSIDRPTYDFWLTIENDVGSGGPFANEIIVKTNIDGGLGVWCGYGPTYDTLIIPLTP